MFLNVENLSVDQLIEKQMEIRQKMSQAQNMGMMGPASQLQNMLDQLNIELRRLRAKTFKKFLENYNRALSSRDAEKYVDGEDDVVDLTKIVNDFALLRNQWLGITKGLDQKQWQITNIVKLRVAGMEDADIK